MPIINPSISSTNLDIEIIIVYVNNCSLNTDWNNIA